MDIADGKDAGDVEAANAHGVFVTTVTKAARQTKDTLMPDLWDITVSGTRHVTCFAVA